MPGLLKIGTGRSGCVLAAGLCLAWGGQAFGVQDEAEQASVASVLEDAGADARAFHAHVTTLSNPFFEGRAPGTRGNRLAADYIERYFREFGLGPAFETVETGADGTEVVTKESSYRQPFTAKMKAQVLGQRVSLHLGDGEEELEAGVDFALLPFSGGGKVTAPAVFVGYAIGAGPDGYASFNSGDDLSGKIAIVMRFEPLDDAGKSRWSEDGEWSGNASIGPKMWALRARKPAGIILVHPPGADDERVDNLASATSMNLFGMTLGVPVVIIKQGFVDRFIREADAQGRSLEDLRKLADESGGLIELEGAEIMLEADVLTRGETDNVGGVLRGKGDLADEFIVVGGHYDHVGYGYTGANPANIGKIHPGADDNASGTSAMLVIAQKFAAAYAELPDDADVRSVLFMAFSAEESGLNGSKFYTQHPTIDSQDIFFMLNLDMVGRLRGDKLEVDGTDSAEGLEDWTKPYFEAAGLEMAPSSVGSGRSDHASFRNVGIPVLFFFTGLHPDYHTPTDRGYLINHVGGGRVIGLGYEVAMGMAQRTEPLVFKGAQRGQARQAGARGSSRVRFGISVDQGASGDTQIVVGRVFDDTTASEAGLEVGDRIIRWDGKDVTGTDDWGKSLRNHKPGDKVEFVFKRDGEEHVVTCTLRAARRSGGSGRGG